MSHQDDDTLKRLTAKYQASQDDANSRWTAKSIYAEMDKIIIGNPNYKEALSLLLSDYLGPKGEANHLLVVGPSGTGKTFLLKKLLPILKIPSKIIDAANLVGAGYAGTTLMSSLEDFYKSNMMASKKAIIVVDEFDKISDKAGNNWCHQVQSELLTLVDGRQEGAVDTRNALWIFAGAFAYTDEMKRNPPAMNIFDLLKYSFKNELLGRIDSMVMTDIPSIEDLIKRVLNDDQFKSFYDDCASEGKTVTFDDDALLEMIRTVQRPEFGMRMLSRILLSLRKKIVFGNDDVIHITTDYLKGCI